MSAEDRLRSLLSTHAGAPAAQTLEPASGAAMELSWQSRRADLAEMMAAHERLHHTAVKGSVFAAAGALAMAYGVLGHHGVVFVLGLAATTSTPYAWSWGDRSMSGRCGVAMPPCAVSSLPGSPPRVSHHASRITNRIGSVQVRPHPGTAHALMASGRPGLPGFLDVDQGLPQLPDPVLLVLTDQPDAPGQRVRAGTGDAGVHQGVEHPAVALT